ncbi:MAG: hypothetical protein AABZ92_00665, partial [Verrucomicrobiota bacterium]
RGKILNLRYLGMTMPSLSKEILKEVPAYITAQEYNIPINFYNSANGTLDRAISQISFDGGIVKVSLLGNYSLR